MPVKSKLKLKSASASSSAAEGEDEDSSSSSGSQGLWLASVLSRLTFRSHGYLRKVLLALQGALQGAVFGAVKTVGTGVLSGAGHVTPKFSFPETMITNEFGDTGPFVANLMRAYLKSGLKQWWRVFLSTNLLGDPIGLGTSVTGGVVQFFRKTGSEIMSGDLRGEGVKSLTQGVVGGTFAHAGKLLGALGDTVDALAQTEGTGYEAGSVTHAGDGLATGVLVFGHSCASGVKGLYERPIEGFQRRGIAGLATGLLKGFAGAVAKPVSGLMHGAKHIAEGVDATTRLWDNSQPIRPRRAPRRLGAERGLRPLRCCDFSPKVTIFVEGITVPGGGRLTGGTYRVLLRSSQGGSEAAWEKHTKQLPRLTHSGDLVFEEAKWVPTCLLVDHGIEIEVQDCALAPDPRYGEALYRARLPCETAQARLLGPPALLPLVAELMQHPQPGALTQRLRPARCARVPLEPAPGGGAREGAQLLLRFWPGLG